MTFDSLLGGGLGSLPLMSDSLTRSISAENPTGEPAGGAHADPGETGPATCVRCSLSSTTTPVR